MADRHDAGNPIRQYSDDSGHAFEYVAVRHDGATDLVIHFSAFFGAWGNAPESRYQFQGYFHRLRMLGDDPDHNWLFLCDPYGADRNGTYYTGQGGDFFVERGTRRIIEMVMAEVGVPSTRVVTVGSSMGATGALKFGLMLNTRGIVAVAPHIDLDICAARQNRMRHVAFICPDGDPRALHNFRYTRQIGTLVAERNPENPPPALFLQAAADDAGVYPDQVTPLIERWREAGGEVALDLRDGGGHTSDFATRALLLDAITRLREGQAIDVEAYRRAPFQGQLTAPSLETRLRSRAARTRRRLLRWR